ncbi:hypothetical protein COW36_11935 [bacterium (Candidatus Blackallbacteria) CG17_big_fil_post_rev_8_21_14_2_50_48_46]|uniref:Pyrrolo-quinoline quinone repeat domain-containing protein n=1 Tax=bacterium (Candidatus Blackallbacteria) CG17_big_fil_post_rev_8_21_14_2_50_48_46 TaxID=2014261 RepID=A0A2M7G3M0_9BACT|nr:MAG: hypothetical protein COW64_03325 [bacterium (Candidatus Blackallbacteria) CG18_big_fil_WC_8_21_14_2_50_49_26]PIW16473.1 MAG: hypothetical protein COW36_11935 [bacterium (Candidatus Blackallbacteria) CG17_big_fil_post_rev_8_21_14_2_50_48_46]PIW45981.1 MAG: hypothetical protein COW20_17200 [bacterium (Candidatus Blackallbacteria) CG13_big_fil_rev_8_21_14_2_50_49_14]
MKLPTLISTSLLSLALSLPLQAAEADWPMFQKDPQHTGQSKVSRSVKDPVIRWKMPVGVSGWLNSPLIADQKVFIGSSGYLWQMPDFEEGNESESLKTDGVYAFDLKSGKALWYAPAGNDVNGIAYDQDTVYATGDEGAVWALEAGSGTQKWKTALGSTTYQLLVHQGVVYSGNNQGQFFALDAKSGKILWKTQLEGAIRAGAALAEDRLILGTTAGKVYALSLKGKIRWQQDIQKLYPEYSQGEYKTPVEVYASATIYKQSAIIGFARDTLYPTPALLAFDIRTGKQLWQGDANNDRSNWGNIRTSPVLYKDLLIYAEPYSNEVIAIRADTGKALGSTALGFEMFPQWASPALSGELVIIPRHDGGLYSLSAAKGKPAWSLYIGEPNLAGKKFPEGITSGGGATYTHPNIGDAVFSSPAISNQGEILIAAGGYLYCIVDASW